jgi:hypothetical protein
MGFSSTEKKSSIILTKAADEAVYPLNILQAAQFRCSGYSIEV